MYPPFEEKVVSETEDKKVRVTFNSRTFMFCPRPRLDFFFVFPSVVSVGKEPFSNFLFFRYGRFVPPDGFFLWSFPCHTDNVCSPL